MQFRVREFHIPASQGLEQVIFRLLPQLELDHKPVRIYRGGLIITLIGRYEPCGACGRPRTIDPGDAAETCRECDLRSYNDRQLPERYNLNSLPKPVEG